MAQERISTQETNRLIDELLKQRYGHTLNDAEFAKKADVSMDDVANLRQQNPVPADCLLRLASGLGVTIDELKQIGGYEPMRPEERRHLQERLAA